MSLCAGRLFESSVLYGKSCNNGLACAAHATVPAREMPFIPFANRFPRVTRCWYMMQSAPLPLTGVQPVSPR